MKFTENITTSKGKNIEITYDVNSSGLLLSISAESIDSDDSIPEMIIPAMHSGQKITSIGSNVLTGKLANIPINVLTITGGITNFMQKAFYAAHITTVFLPNTIKNISHRCFENSDIKEVCNSCFIQNIHHSGFKNCKKLESIGLQNCRSIGDSAFSNCINLKSCSVPKLRMLGKSAFASCKRLEYINIPVTCKDIPKNCFYDCMRANEVILNAYNLNIDSTSFMGTKMKSIFCPNVLDTSKLKTLYNLRGIIRFKNSNFYL